MTRHTPSLRSAAAGLSMMSLLACLSLSAQIPPDIARERADYQTWLTTSANSPLLAVAQLPLGDGLRLGSPDGDVPLPGMGEHRVFTDGSAVMLEGPSGKRSLGRGRSTRVGSHTLYLTGSPGGSVLTVFAAKSEKQPPGHYPYLPSLVFIGPLRPPERPGKVRLLAPNGIEAEASEAGSVLVPLAGGTRLRVFRIPSGGAEESELEVFFQDQTNGQGSYPGGRFVSLIPVGDGNYRLDFNRARNPFCAYSNVYPCPAPWRGNLIRAPVSAGERYAGGGLDAPVAGGEAK
jgi:hypothetical protein